MCIDLHTHSVYSDGSATVEELINLAGQHNLHALALTDHDTIEGVKEAQQLGASIGIPVISGVEISCTMRQHTVHILGYGFDAEYTALRDWLKPLQEGRKKRNTRILEKLQGLGINISWDDVKKLSPCGQTGRPHFARALINKGVVTSFQEAFGRFLGRNKPAYVSRFAYTATEAITMLHHCGAVAVLAHPGQLDPEMRMQSLVIQELALRGLDGLEIFYPSHTRKMKKKLRTIAQDHHLLVTGGSDYHGPSRANHQMACQSGGFCPPDGLLPDLQQRIAMRHH